MNTFSLAQVEAWIDRNMFIGSTEAARTAMEDAKSMEPEQADYAHANRLLDRHTCVIVLRNDPLGLTYQDMASRGLVDIEEGTNDGEIEVTRK